MRKIIPSIFIILFMAVACVTAPISEDIPDKYNLDSQLERLVRGRVINNRVIDIIDKQSFTMHDPLNYDYYYLIILKNPSNFLPISPSVLIQTSDYVTGSHWFIPGDRVTSWHDGGYEHHFIGRIYKIKNREEAKAIKRQLIGEGK